MTTYRYHTCDVFTDQRFGGNQLAVLPHAHGLTSELMHAIAREFNYPESTFVFPPDSPRHTRRVRIFTPGGELPFAGHPTVGTAFVLAAIGEIALTGDETRVVFEEGVGPVPVLIRAEAGRPVFSQLSVAKLPEVMPPLPDREVLASILSLHADDIGEGRFSPQGVSCGLPFAFVPVRSRDALRRSRLRMEPWEAHLRGTPNEMIFVFTMDGGRPGSDVRGRMYAPSVNVPEDPATGSACAALGGYLAMRSAIASGTLRWTVEQGFEMGRPSILHVEVDKLDGRITAVRVGGSTVMVCSGEITV
ncbi:MAG: Trans-2,3-dihydro-3-hydroxyanthranilate isomerase [Gemmatimonadaceae bacterium]|nr:Trans-2,3-dihydro-3-hydroxyanthranilate isomerase [Gemmatimonadaceae bacterium]